MGGAIGGPEEGEATTRALKKPSGIHPSNYGREILSNIEGEVTTVEIRLLLRWKVG